MTNMDDIAPDYYNGHRGKRFKFDIAHVAIIDELAETPIYPKSLGYEEIIKLVNFLNVQWEEIQRLQKVNEYQNGVIIQLEEMKKLVKRVEKLEYELTCIDGLYASDNKDMLQPFKLDFKKVLDDD